VRPLLAVAAALLLALAAPARAQQYPTAKPIRLIVPFPAGGSADNVTRIVARGLSDGLGQQVIVENKPGGDGIIAASALLQSVPDGYTLLMGTATGMNAVPVMRKTPPYDPVADFTPISRVGNFVHLLVVHNDVPAQTLQELIAYARANPGKLNYATTNFTAQAGTLQLMKAAGIDMVHVPYKGGAPATAATMSGEVAALFSGTSSAPQIKAGRLRALAVAGAKRSPTFPDLPTIGEFYPGFENSIWLGLFGPASMPEDVLNRLRTEVRRALESPDVKASLFGKGSLETLILSPEEFNTLIRRDYERFGKLIRDIGVKAD